MSCEDEITQGISQLFYDMRYYIWSGLFYNVPFQISWAGDKRDNAEKWI
jgi:hypothetical protein